MGSSKQLNEIISKLGDKKYDFLNEVKREVNSYISNQGAKCLSIIEKRKRYSNRTWELSASISYIEVLIAFCQGKKYNGNELDSYLTSPIIDIVTKKYQKFYKKNDDIVSSGVFKIVFERKDFVKELASSLVKNRLSNSELLQVALKKSSRHLLYNSIADKSSSLITDQVQSLIQDNAVDAIMYKTQHIVGSAVSVPVIKTIAVLIIKLFSKQIVAIIGKILASTAFKAIIGAVLKKFILAVLLSTIVKLIAAKFGIAAGTAWAFVLLPIIAGYIAYSIVTFPDTLGQKVSEKIYQELSGNFDNINRDVMQKIIMDITKNQLSDIVDNLSENKELQDSIDQLILKIINE